MNWFGIRGSKVVQRRAWCGAAFIAALTMGMPAGAAAQVTAYAFVPNFNSFDTSVIDTRTNTVIATIPVGFYPIRAAVSPDGRRALVVNTGTGDLVTVIDVASLTAVKTLHVGHVPYWVAITPDGSKAYVANLGSDTISVIDMATETVAPTPIALAFGSGPVSVVFTPDGQRAIVANQVANTLSVIDVATDTVDATIPVSDGPLYLAAASDGHTVYVTHPSFDTVGVINVSGGVPEVILSAVPGSEPRGIAISPDGTRVWIANSNTNTISILDSSDGTLVDTITVGADPRYVAFSPDSAFAYVSNFASNSVSVIEVATSSVVSTIPAGTSPHFVAMTPTLIVGPAPTAIAGDTDLTTQGFRNYVSFLGGTLHLTGNWTTTRTLSLLSGGAVTTATIDTGGFNATINATVINDALLVKRGAGTLTLQQPRTSGTGVTRVTQGTLAINSTHPGVVQVLGSAGVRPTLAGEGVIGSISPSGGAFISPGNNGPGVLHATSAVLDADTTLVIQINGPAAGTGYDQLNATDAFVLAGATLDLHVGYAPAPGAQFTILTNDRTGNTFAGLPEGAVFTADGKSFRITYHGGSGSDVVLTYDTAPTLSVLSDQTIGPNSFMVPIPFTVGDDLTSPSSLLVTVTSSNHSVVHDNPQENTLAIDGTGAARTLLVTPERNASGQATITIAVSEGAQTTQRSFLLTVTPMRSYYLAEGSTGAFFWTDIAIANPNPTPAAVEITFYKDDGTQVVQPLTLLPTSSVTIPVSFVPGMEAAAFSTSVVSQLGLPLVVERTMWWDRVSRYGASTEKATEQSSTQWYFAEGSQGYFHSYFLLLNPNTTDTIAHVTYLMEDGPTVSRDYPVHAGTRVTVDAGDVPELINRSFGAHIVFDQPGFAERAMYFGMSPLFSGGSVGSGVTAPASDWFLAEGATGSFFDTFVLIANPNDTDANVSTTYLPADGDVFSVLHHVAAHQRLTINIATEDLHLRSAAVSTRVRSDQPVVVERSQYWPHGGWYESHTSAGETALGTRWGIADGRVGGPNAAQTFILIANPNPDPAEITATFLRTDGTTLVTQFTVPRLSRFNIAVIGDGNGNVPELTNESFGTVIDSTQPVAVEHSLYTNANGTIWAAGTNATATRLP